MCKYQLIIPPAFFYYAFVGYAKAVRVKIFAQFLGPAHGLHGYFRGAAGLVPSRFKYARYQLPAHAGYYNAVIFRGNIYVHEPIRHGKADHIFKRKLLYKRARLAVRIRAYVRGRCMRRPAHGNGVCAQ